MTSERRIVKSWTPEVPSVESPPVEAAAAAAASETPQSQAEAQVPEPKKKRGRASKTLRASEYVWSVLRDQVNPITSLTVVQLVNDKYLTGMSVDAVRSVLDRMVKTGCAVKLPSPTYLDPITEKRAHPRYAATEIAPFSLSGATPAEREIGHQIRKKSAAMNGQDATETAQRMPKGSSSRGAPSGLYARDLLHKVTTALQYGVESQRKKHPPYPPGVIEWLDKTDLIFAEVKDYFSRFKNANERDRA